MNEALRKVLDAELKTVCSANDPVARDALANAYEDSGLPLLAVGVRVHGIHSQVGAEVKHLPALLNLASERRQLTGYLNRCEIICKQHVQRKNSLAEHHVHAIAAAAALNAARFRLIDQAGTWTCRALELSHDEEIRTGLLQWAFRLVYEFGAQPELRRVVEQTVLGSKCFNKFDVYRYLAEAVFRVEDGDFVPCRRVLQRVPADMIDDLSDRVRGGVLCFRLGLIGPGREFLSGWSEPISPDAVQLRSLLELDAPSVTSPLSRRAIHSALNVRWIPLSGRLVKTYDGSVHAEGQSAEARVDGYPIATYVLVDDMWTVDLFELLAEHDDGLDVVVASKERNSLQLAVYRRATTRGSLVPYWRVAWSADSKNTPPGRELILGYQRQR